MSPPFPFLLLGLRVCVCFPKSCFVLRAALAWFRFAGPSLPPSLPLARALSLSLSGEGGRGSLGCRWGPSLRRPRPEPPPPAGASVECPPTTLASREGVRLLRGSLLRRSFPAPLPSSAAGVASRRVARRRRLRAELGRSGGRRGGVPGGRRQRPVLGTFEPVVGSHLAAAFILSLPSGASARPFRRIVTQPPGPRQSSQAPATLAATVPVAPRPRDSPAVAGDWFSRFPRRVIVAALRSRLVGWPDRPDRVDRRLPVPLRPRRRTARTLPGPGRRGGRGEGLPCPERLDSGSAVRTPPGPPSGAFASPSAPLPRRGPAQAVAWRSPEGAPGFFVPEVFSASRSGVVRVDRGRRVCGPPWAPVARGVSRHPCFFSVRVPMGPETWMHRTLLPRVAGEGALDPSACPRGSRSSDAALAHPCPTP